MPPELLTPAPFVPPALPSAPAPSRPVIRLLRNMKTWPIAWMWTLSVLLVLVDCIIDYVTGADLSVATLYFAPVFVAAWFIGRRAGIIIACLSAIATSLSDVLASPNELHSFVLIWNLLMIASVFLIVALLIVAFHESHEHLEEVVEERTRHLQNEINERIAAERRLAHTNADLSTAREELQQSLNELQNTQIQLIEAAKQESIGRLAAGIAHEVKNPLTTLSLGADYLLHFTAANPRDAEMLNDMKHAVQRAGDIINLLLDFAKPRPLALAQENINKLIETSLSLMRMQFSRQALNIVCQLDPHLPPLMLDKNRIEHMLLNLFTNAAHAMPTGGTLTVRTFIRPKQPGDTSPPAVIVDISDTGHGIPKHIADKIFDPFFTTKAPGQGTGLGLSIVRKIMEIHGGSITLANRPEGGVQALLQFTLLPRGVP